VPEEIVKGETKPLLEVTLHAGDILYMPRGFVHEAYTTEEEASLHLTIALATHDWAWSTVAAAALSLAGENDENVATFRADVERAAPDASLVDHRWRHSVPPALVCHAGSHDASAQEKARSLAAIMIGADKRLEGRGLLAKDLATSLASKVAVHNGWQDELQPVKAAALCLDSFVRRLTKSEKEEGAAKKAKAKGASKGCSGGLVARDEIGDVLMKIIASIDDTTAVSIRDFENAPLLCDFSKVRLQSIALSCDS
jgi:hypothetical protein